MKRKNTLTQVLETLFLCLLAVIGLSGCEENTITALAGQMPETGALDESFAVLSSTSYAENEVLLDINKAASTDACCLKLTRPATQTMSFTVAIDSSMVKSYNETHDTDYPIFPEEEVTLSSQTLTLEVGKMQSSTIEITVNYNELHEPGIYLLPVKVKKDSGDAAVAEKYQCLFYLINVWPEFSKNKYTLRNKEYVQIGYLDPEVLNPLIINELYLGVKTIRPATPYWHDILFDIVNLQGATLKKDAQKNIKLDIKEDLNYILINKTKYIAPLQAQKHKVCLSITGSGDGTGFSNLTGNECSSLIYQIKSIVEHYKLDGVNILDRNLLYNLSINKLPSTKNLIYFMAGLRKALPGKVITLAISEETPAEVDQVIDDIKLGDLVDYAWADEQNDAVNPWLDDSQYKIIAGLEKAQWGVAVTKPTSNDDENRRVHERTREIAKDGVNKVFVHYLVRNKAGLETTFSTFWRLGAAINWPLDIKANKWYSAEIECPIEYLDIHSSVWLKDW